jgi:hypothetical protein
MMEAMITTFNIVPIPALCFNGNHSNRMLRLMRKVRSPIPKPVFSDSPSARTVHGLIPTDAVIINDSPKPNNAKPMHSIKTVRNLGDKFNGLSELHRVIGTDFIEKISIASFI